LIQNVAETLPINANTATVPNDTSKPKNWETYPLASPRIDAPIVWPDERTPKDRPDC